MITITKEGTFLKFTGLTKSNTTLPVLDNGTLYLTNYDMVGGFSGNKVIFREVESSDKAVTVSFDDITNKHGQTNAENYVAYLNANGFLAKGVAIDAASIGDVFTEGRTKKLKIC